MRAFERYAVVASLVATATASVACGLLVPLEREVRRTTVDGGDAAADLDPCGPIPERPAPSTEGPSMPPLMFGGYRISVTGDNDATRFCPEASLDLDGVTTGPVGRCDENRSCTPLPSPNRPFGCDAPGGGDRGLADLVDVAAAGIGFTQQFLNADSYNLLSTKGVATSLLVLSSYNGRADDPSVEVGVMGAAGALGVNIPPADLTNAGLAKYPDVWTGVEDVAWRIDETTTSRTGSFTSPAYTARGYVRGHVLVVPSLLPGRLPLLLFSRPFYFEGGQLIGRIAVGEKGQRSQLSHVRFGFRMPAREVLAFAGSLSAGSLGKSGELCTADSKSVYEGFVRPALCAALDLPAPSAGPDTTCAALSVGLQVAYAETRLATNKEGEAIVGPPLAASDPPCVDADAGTEWCDDCAWSEAKRCPLTTLDAGADAR